jgi:membrane-bound lytic murein transglycosylase D
MLKTRFSKAFYLCNSFLLIALPFTTAKNKTISVPLISKENRYMDKKVFASAPVNRVDNPAPSDMPEINLNKKEALFVRKYIKNRGDCLVNVKKRSIIPFYIIDSVFTVYNIPVELKYLAVIESELKPTALSHVGARGPWQLMPGTAKLLGLTVNRHCDERTNFSMSTKAAARYLKDLYAQFDDWLLVLAAYNGGPKPVWAAIRASGSKNFWSLQKYLPAESREHVKKFIATHYYFEGHGSETTLTRSENIAYMNAVNEFEMKKTNPATDKSDEPRTIIPRPLESSDEKFKRVMKESEECLHRSGKLI